MIGVVIVAFNAADATLLTLRSVLAANNNCGVRLVVVDNASEIEDRERVRSFVESMPQTANFICEYVQSERNLGFSGGNNIGIKLLLEDLSVTHICLLNSDVLVTDFWLDRLLAHDSEAISAVTNRADSEQFIPEPYDLTVERVCEDDASFDAAICQVDELACHRATEFSGQLVECEVTFFCVLLSRRAVEVVGLLDETFFPGGFEDDDYCIRLKKAGIPVHLARDVYIHHFGSASFTKLEYKYFAGRAKENLRYLQRKHRIKWKRRPEKSLVSFLMDLEHIEQQGRPITAGQRASLNRHLDQLDASISHHGSEFVSLKGEYMASAKRTKKLDCLIATADEHGSLAENWVKFSNRIRREINSDNLSADFPEILRDGANLTLGIWSTVESNFLINANLRNVVDVSVPNPATSEWFTSKWANKSGLPKIIWTLYRTISLLLRFNGIVFFGGYFYPEREKDGYFQRIKMIDGLVENRWRLYVETDELAGRMSIVDRPQPKVIVLRLLGGRRRKLLMKLAVWLFVLRSRRIYFHSVLRMLDHGFGKLMELPFIHSVVDIHGVVPEEFRMHHDYYSAVRHEREEERAVEHADQIVVVSDAMKQYLLGKFRGVVNAEFILFPMFPNFQPYFGKKPSDMGAKPIAVYAGGLQRWQQPIKTIKSMIATNSVIESHFLCPQPDAAAEIADTLDPKNEVIFDSMTHDELMKFYKECDYGYILREDSVVNHVACPTKIVEYLANGIVPIIDSANIGDFTALGMRSLSAEELEKGIVPDKGKTSDMALNNFRVYSALKKQKDEGALALSKCLKGTLAASTVQVDGTNSECIDVLVQVGNFEAGGLENVVHELNEFMKDSGLNIALLILGTEGPAAKRARDAGQRVIAEKFSREAYEAILDQTKPKVVLTHYSTDGIDICESRDTPVVQVIHNIYMWLNGDALGVFRDAAALTTKFVAVSDKAKQYSVARLGVEEAICEVIENGIDIQKFANVDRATIRNRLREQFNIGQHDFVFLDMAAINHQKNHLDVLRAFNIARHGCDNAKLVIVGPVYEPGLLAELEEMISSNSLESKVQILNPTGSPWEMYAMADAFVNASYFEGGPLTLVEALASNLPVIMPDVGVAGSFREQNGVELVEPAADIIGFEGNIDQLQSRIGFTDDLANAMMRVWCNPTRPDLTEAQLQKISKERTYFRYIKTLLGLIE